jgi:peptidoglycan/xylan/chitin deacetylase (PgdA/CDA1 family)
MSGSSRTKNWAKHFLGSQRITTATSYLLPKHVVVLMYHDLCHDDDFTSWLRVKQSQFEIQIDYLSKIGTFIHPKDLFQSEALSNHHLNLLVTFDDGFVNQHRLAMPILEKYNVPALFFITTENAESGELFWFDRIVTPIQQSKINRLKLSHLGLDNYNLPSAEGPERWAVIQTLLEDIKHQGNYTSSAVKGILRFFEEEFGTFSKDTYSRLRPLTPHEIMTMSQSSLCSFGSHSHRHDILPLLSEPQIKANLEQSKEFLEDTVGTPIAEIAYPNGSTSTQVIELCKASGYKYGYMTTPGLVRQESPHFSLPRISVSGYDSLKTLLWKINRELMKAFVGFRSTNIPTTGDA